MPRLKKCSHQDEKLATPPPLAAGALDGPLRAWVEQIVTVSIEKFQEVQANADPVASKVPPTKLLFSEQQAADALGISHATLKKWRLGGAIEAYTTGRKILYQPRDLEKIRDYIGEWGGAGRGAEKQDKAGQTETDRKSGQT